MQILIALVIGVLCVLVAMLFAYRKQDLLKNTILTGAQGPSGPPGDSIVGETGPTGSQGEKGDPGPALTIVASYIDLAAFNAALLAGELAAYESVGNGILLLSDGSLYLWFTDDGWIDVGDLKGPPGIQGASGARGPSGPSGPSGPTFSPGLYVQTSNSASITSSSNPSEQSIIGSGIGTLTVPANGFSLGDSFILKMCGKVSCGNNQQIKFRAKSNGTVIIDFPIFLLDTTTDHYFDFLCDFTISKIGGLGVAELRANGSFTFNQSAGTQFHGQNYGQINTTTFSTTINNTLSVTAEWITSNVANTISTQNLVLYKVF